MLVKRRLPCFTTVKDMVNMCFSKVACGACADKAERLWKGGYIVVMELESRVSKLERNSYETNSCTLRLRWKNVQHGACAAAATTQSL